MDVYPHLCYNSFYWKNSGGCCFSVRKSNRKKLEVPKMGDMYREILVKKKTSGGAKFLKGLMTTMTVLCLLAGFVIPVLLVGAVVFGLLTYFVAPKLDVEYEYLYVNGELDIDAIYSRQKRKRVGSYDVSELEILAPAKSHALDSYLNNGAKVTDYTSGDEHVKSYIMVFNKEKGRQIIKTEIDDVIIGDLRRVAPRKVNLI